MDANQPQNNEDLRGLLWLLGLGAAALAGLVLMQAFRTPGERTAPSLREAFASRVDDWMGVRGEPRAQAETPLVAIPRTGLGAYATGVQDEDDPQMQAFRQSYRNDTDAGVGQPFSIAYHQGSLLSTSGVAGLSAGASCEVRVLPVSSFSFNCLLRVTCDGVVLYPDDALQAGYAPCEVEAGRVLSAVDDSSRDGDREIDLNMRTRVIEVRERDIEGQPMMSARVLLGGY